MNQELVAIKNELVSVYDGSPWYGENMIAILSKVKSAKAYDRRFPGKHSVTELLLHIINWRLFTVSRFNREFDFEMKDWQKIEKPDEELWNNAMLQLEDTQKKLLNILNIVEDNILENIVSERTYNYRFLLNGTIQHDIYHTAQIAYCL